MMVEYRIATYREQANGRSRNTLGYRWRITFHEDSKLLGELAMPLRMPSFQTPQIAVNEAELLIAGIKEGRHVKEGS